MTSMYNFSPWLREAWAAWEVLRKLGFASDDIFWIFGHVANLEPDPGYALNIILQTQGLEFSITCSGRLTEEEARALQDEATVFQHALIDGAFKDDELTKVLHESLVWREQIAFLASLKAKGFVFPYTLN